MTSRRVEVWTVPDDPAGFRLIDIPDVETAKTNDPFDNIGGGEITLRSGYPYAGEILDADPTDPGSSKASLIRLFREAASTPDYEFFADEALETVDDEGQGTVTVRGKDVRSGLDDGVVDEDVIWGGANAIPSLKLEDLNNIRAEWRVYLERDRYGLSITATGGTFTFSYAGNTTDTIGVDPSAGTIKSRLEDLPGITEVDVTKHEDDSFTVVVLNPTVLASDITINTGGLTGGSASWTKHASGFDSSSNPTFTLEIETEDGTDETGPIAWNASLSTIEAAVQALDNVQDVTVTGAGTFGDPWHFIFYVPAIVDDVACNFSAGDAVVTEVEAGRLDPSPVTRSMYADQRIDPAYHGSPNLQVSVTTDPADLDDGASWALRVPASAQFDGSQIILRVTPGQLYQVSIRVKPTVAGRYRLVIRDRFEGLIKWTTPTEVPLSAGTYQTLTVPDVRIPDGVTEVIMRVAVVSSNPSEIDTFHVNWEGARFEEGLPATTAGDIVQHVKSLLDARNVLSWVDTSSFTGVLDANGDVWDVSNLRFRADAGEKFGTHVLGDLQRMGYEWDLRAKPMPEEGFGPGDPTHDLLLWNPGGRSSGVDVTQAVVVGGLASGSKFAKRRVPRTHILVETDDGERTWVSDARFDGLPRREDFIRAEYAFADHASQVAQAAFDDDVSNLFASQVRLASGVVAYRDFDLGDEVPHETGRVGRHVRRVHNIALRLDGDVWVEEVTASRLFADPQSETFEAIRRLYAEFARRRRPRPDGPVVAGGGRGMAHILIVSTSEPEAVQAKADFVVPAVNSAGPLQEILDGFVGTAWLAGIFDLETDLFVSGNGTRLRGLGYTSVSC